MRRFIVLLLLFATGIMAQNETWGRKITFGNTFVNTDSLKLFELGVATTISDTYVLYSNGLDIPGQGLEGILGVAAYFDEESGTSASIAVDVRFGNTFRSTFNTTNVKWDHWESIWAACEKDSLYRIGIAASDSSWWNPAADVIQLRLTEADDDTVTHNVSLYIR